MSKKEAFVSYPSVFITCFKVVRGDTNHGNGGHELWQQVYNLIFFTMGQAFGFLVIFSIIYFPLIRPLTMLGKGDILIRRTLSTNELAKLKSFSIVITIYHLLLSLLTFVFTIVKTSVISNELGSSFVTEYHFFIIIMILTISICFGVTLYFILRKKDNVEFFLKLSFIIPIHVLIGMVSSFFLGGHLFFNINQKVIGIIMLSMLVLEVVYLINLYRFQKRIGIVWEKSKPENENRKPY